MKLLPESWQPIIGEELEKPYFKKLREFLEQEKISHTIYPPEDEIFSALELTSFENVKVLLLGQDPYHGVNQAHGLCFSVLPEIKTPRSLNNIFAELKNDVGSKIPNNGYLVQWAKQGILLLNAVLTVRAGEPNSHKNKGWEIFTDAIIRKVSEKKKPVAFVLWGDYARRKKELIAPHHTIIESPHPSPFSAHRGFFGSKPFSKINAALCASGEKEIDWQIPNLPAGMIQT